MHFEVDPETLQSQLPDSVQLDLFNGKAYVGIVPFQMSDVAPRFCPELPWVSRFPELNVRTYVTVDGKPGVWFFSLDATSRVAVRAARTLFNLNYLDAKISLKKPSRPCPGNWINYHSVRTDAHGPAAELHCEYRPVGDWYFARPTTLTHWLTARYCLYTADNKGNVYRGEINHAPWRLQDAQAIVHANSMTDGLGLDISSTRPILHYAQSTKVVAWLLEKV